MKKSLKIVIALAVLAALIVGALFLYKELVVEVIHADGSTKDFTIDTDSENLRGALEQEDLIEGDNSSYGLYVTTVDGERADESKREWWCFTKDGEMLMTGVDDTMIQDGEHYEITFTAGW